MKATKLLPTFIPMALSLFLITPTRGDETKFTVTYEWAAKPILTLSKGQGDTYRISLDVDSVPSKRLPALLAELDEHHAPKVAAVRMTQLDTNGDNAHATIAFDSIPSEQVGAAMKLLIDLLDLQQITMDANVFEGKRIDELLNLLRSHKSTSRNVVPLHELISAIHSSLPDTIPHDSGWIVEIEGYHCYE